MTVLPVLILASKLMLLPLALFNFSVMWLSILLSVNTVLSMFHTASLKVMIMLSLIDTPVAPLRGLNVTVGAMLSVPPWSPLPPSFSRSPSSLVSSPSSFPSAVPAQTAV